MRYVIGAIILYALWLLMSGVYKPVTMTLGVLSSIAAVWIASRMNREDGVPVRIQVSLMKYLGYLVYLMREIVKSNINVLRAILSPSLNFRPAYVRVPHTQQTELGKVTFANSITLTPGTLTVEVNEDHFMVHALDFSEDDMHGMTDMNDRITATETT